MGTVIDLINNLNSLNITETTINALVMNKKEMVMLNQVQLFAGLNAQGKNFRQYVFDWYASMKNEMNPEPGMGNPDLKLTGSFYRSMFSEIKGDDIIIDATDRKKNWLVEHYSSGDRQTIFGLTPDNKTTFIETCFYPDFKNIVEAATGLKFNK